MRCGFAHRLFEIVRLPQLGKQRACLAFHHLQQRVVRLAQWLRERLLREREAVRRLAEPHRAAEIVDVRPFVGG
ncbi:hypothetical protein [Burkholderia sp. BCC0405]|uniref:hypothetical protein n=1 Tax=Burkholderia sp. BCC0405 TaxID=2676298 RepID=UPI001FC80769|nr:hypothetical protein [Burkholderia sp. BCC0405]